MLGSSRLSTPQRCWRSGSQARVADASTAGAQSTYTGYAFSQRCSTGSPVILKAHQPHTRIFGGKGPSIGQSYGSSLPERTAVRRIHRPDRPFSGDNPTCGEPLGIDPNCGLCTRFVAALPSGAPAAVAVRTHLVRIGRTIGQRRTVALQVRHRTEHRTTHRRHGAVRLQLAAMRVPVRRRAQIPAHHPPPPAVINEAINAQSRSV